MKQILFSDIDGTIISEKGIVSEKVSKFFSNIMQDKEFDIVLVTGRSYKYVESLGLPFDAITSNGGEIYRIIDREVQLQRLAQIDTDTFTRLTKYLNNINSVYVVSTERGNIILKDTDIIPTVVKLAYLHGNDPDEVIKGIGIYYDIIYTKSIKVDNIMNYIEQNNLTVSKVEVFSGDKGKRNIIEDYQKKFPSLNIFSSHISNIEFTPSDISKKVAIMEYVKGLNEVEIYSIGDGENDISMTEIAKKSFAMGNASENLKTCSDYIVSNVENDGILDAIKIIRGEMN
ncbi:haloacid dehalogenase [Lactococcus hodotermopsidis]|uniref:Haloacid dehalogenase n=1 Tax=Pseudolactococcus hodotermopsidis TaxID=2709157 RepID=A0A6A0BCE4_9LACT|nr:HAD family hydrolase [Lactococcus hodotermopsidis]GFH43079.1 haloacid dehalogenase [Lactococcus hodotermopsidis]